MFEQHRFLKKFVIMIHYILNKNKNIQKKNNKKEEKTKKKKCMV